jgi:divalent metal cation (Fe/Co/Zn/Cd) transporter
MGFLRLLIVSLELANLSGRGKRVVRWITSCSARGIDTRRCGTLVSMDVGSLNRPALVRRGERLEYFTVAWNSLEAVVSIAAGTMAGSISLVGFGLDSVIEVASAVAMLWRLHHDFDPARREAVERATLRIVGASFLALALYIALESSFALIRHEAPERSIAGIGIATAAVIVMPMMAKAKRRVAAGIGSGAMHADSKQADFCAYLSAILLGGLLLNALFGWWWADPSAALAMVPIIAKEGVDGLKGKQCCDGACQGSR